MDSFNSAEVIQVIRTTLTTRGDGKKTIMRPITQYWSLDGQLLAEVDPCPDDDVSSLKSHISPFGEFINRLDAGPSGSIGAAASDSRPE